MKEFFRKQRDRQYVLWDLVWSGWVTILIIALHDLDAKALLLCPIIYGLLIFRRLGRKAITEWFEIKSKEDP